MISPINIRILVKAMMKIANLLLYKSWNCNSPKQSITIAIAIMEFRKNKDRLIMPLLRATKDMNLINKILKLEMVNQFKESKTRFINPRMNNQNTRMLGASKPNVLTEQP